MLPKGGSGRKNIFYWLPICEKYSSTCVYIFCDPRGTVQHNKMFSNKAIFFFVTFFTAQMQVLQTLL